MRVDQCVVTVESRGPGGIIDLAFVFTRQFGVQILQILALFAIPSTIGVYLISGYTSSSLFWSAALFFAISPFLSAALIASIGPQVFGQPISFRSTTGRIFPRLIGYTCLMLPYRLGLFYGMMCIGFGTLFIPPCGHLAEIMFLEQCPGSKIFSRIKDLNGNGGYVWFFLHVLILGFFWTVLTVGFMLTFDLISTTMFRTPILLGRVVSSPDAGDALANLIMSDTRTAIALHAAIWIPFPLIRIAWFFCYLDHRIRNECWDLEVQFRSEAIRLGESLPSDSAVPETRTQNPVVQNPVVQNPLVQNPGVPNPSGQNPGVSRS